MRPSLRPDQTTEIETASQPLIVSLHDVAPPFENEIRAQLDALASVGIDRVVLKVVPNWHGQYPLDSFPSLVDLLREREAAGCQIVLHGYEHRAVLPYRGRWPRRTRGELFAPGVAEFLSLDESAMECRARRGAEIIARVGLLQPDTFCAPGWLLAPDADEALRRAGIDRLIGMWSVVDLVSGHRRRIPAIGYMGVGGGHERVIGGLNAAVALLAGHAPCPLKLYLHPQNGALSNDALRIVDLAGRLLASESWRLTTFADLSVT